MNLTPNTPDDENKDLAPARKRRARRRMVSLLTPDEQTRYLDTVAQRAAPSFDFFLYSLMSGAILVAGLILDAPHLLVLGALIAPFMAPLIGISLATVLGSIPHFIRSLGGFAIGCLLVLVIGAVGGLLSRLWLPFPTTQASLHSQLSWTPFVLVSLGAAVCSAVLLREEWHRSIASVAIAYALYVPLAVAGFGLGSGISHLWPDGLVLFLIFLATATLSGAVTLAIMGFRPLTLFGFSIGGVVALILILLLLGFGGAGAVVGGQLGLPTATATPSQTATLSPTATLTPLPPTASATASFTPSPSLTPTITLTPSPTPVQALVAVPEGFNGVIMRDAPDGTPIGSLFDGSVVVILGETQIGEGNRLWAKILDLESGQEGWVLQALLVTATPNASLPTETSTATFAPSSTP